MPYCFVDNANKVHRGRLNRRNGSSRSPYSNGAPGQKKIREINEETGAQMRELFQPGSPPDDETRKKMTDLRQASADKMMKRLTEAQKTK